MNNLRYTSTQLLSEQNSPIVCISVSRKHLRSLLSCLLLLSFSNWTLAQIDLQDRLEKLETLLQIRQVGDISQRIAAIRQANYKNLDRQESEPCVTVRLTEQQFLVRTEVNAIAHDYYFGHQPQTNAIAERSMGTAKLRFFFDSLSTTNRGGQSGCVTAATTATANVNGKFSLAGFASSQFVQFATNPVLVNQNWSYGVPNNSSDLLIEFSDWLDTNYPPAPGTPHINIAVYGGDFTGGAGITWVTGCGETAFDCASTNRTYIVVENASLDGTSLLSHEIGHNFSLPHNNTPVICPLGTGGNISGYIMSPNAGATWYSQSLAELSTAVAWNNGQSNNYPFFNATFPLELIDFTGVQIDKAVQLSWRTASEIGHSNMVLSKSTDGLVWEVIHRAQSKANLTGGKYFFDDTKPKIGPNYYELEIDGKSWLQNVNIADPSPILKISPNPSTDIVYFSKVLDDVSLYNVFGEFMQHYRSINEIDLSTFPSGMYFLMDGKANYKIIKAE